MTVGYCLENILAFIFILAALYCQRSGGSRFARAMAKTLVSFYTSAVFFTFSLQIAAIVVLVRVNYGFNANDMGALTMEITWSISLISLLPILYGVLYPELFSIRNSDTLIPSASGQAHTKIQTQPSTELDTNRQEKTLKSLRLWLYLMCWVLSVYPFLSTMLVTFGPSQIGSGPGAVIPKSDFSIIENICWAEISRHSMAEEKAMSCFRVGTFLLIAVITMGKIIILAIEKHFSDSYPTLQESFQRIAEVGRIRETLLFLLPLLFVAQFWTYLRLQTEQLEMSRATGNLDGDLDWSFGQVVALTVFIPVAVDVLFWLRVSD